MNRFKGYANFIVLSFLCVFLITSVSAVARFPSVDPNMIAYYHLNNNATLGENATFAVDSSYGLNNATIINATFNSTFGIFNQGGYSMNGTTDQINIPYSQGLNLSNKNFTISVWISPLNATATRTILSQYDANVNKRSFEITLTPSGTFRLNVYHNGSSANITQATSTASLISGQTYFLTARYSTNNLSVFVNGMHQFSAVPTLGSSIFDSNIRFIIGNNNIASSPLNGTLDEVAIYNRSLTDKEIWTIYQDYNGCLNPSNGTIRFNITYCSGNFQVNSPIVIGANDVIVACQNTNITGDFSNSMFTSIGFNNITVNGCQVNKAIHAIFFRNSANHTITNNNLRDNNFSGIRFSSVNNSLVSGNILYNNTLLTTSSESPLAINDLSYFNNISYNNVTLGYNGIRLANESRSNIIMNNIVRDVRNYGITALSSNNTIISNNYINNSGWNGIAVQSFFSNVSFNIVDYSFHHGIDIFEGGTRALAGNNNVFSNNISRNIGSHGMYIVNSSNNRVYSNYIHDIYNLTDTNNHGAYGIEMDGVGIDGNNSIFNNVINNVSRYCLYTANSFNDSFTNNTISLCDEGDYRLAGATNATIITNDTKSYYSINTSSATNSFFYTRVANNNLFWATTGYNYNLPNIPSNDGDINFNLTSSGFSYSLFEYNKTEGVIRANDPIYFSSSTSTSKVITSNLSAGVTNVLTVVNVDDCNDLGNIRYDSSGYGQTFTRSDYICSSNQVTLTLAGINAGSENVLTINNAGCSFSDRAAYNLILIVGALIILVFVIGYIYKNGGLGEVSLGTMIIIFIGIMVAVAFFWASSQNLSAFCAPIP